MVLGTSSNTTFILGPAPTLEIIVSSVQSCEHEHPGSAATRASQVMTQHLLTKHRVFVRLSNFRPCSNLNPESRCSVTAHSQTGSDPSGKVAAPDAFLPEQQSND